MSSQIVRSQIAVGLSRYLAFVFNSLGPSIVIFKYNSDYNYATKSLALGGRQVIILRLTGSFSLTSSLAIISELIGSSTTRVNLRNREQWNLLVRDELDTEPLALRHSFLHTYHTAKELSEKEDYVDRLEILDTKDNARTNIILLLAQGPDYI